MTNRIVILGHIIAQIAKEEFINHGNKTTIGIFTLKNGYVMVEASSCVDPANYSEEMGKRICREHLIDKIWNLEGYLLQTEMSKQ